MQYETTSSGETREITPVEIKKKEANVSNIVKEANNSVGLLNRSPEEIKEILQMQDQAINAILEQMVLGRHYIEISGIENAFLTQEGSDFLARATGLTVKYELQDKTTTAEFIEYEYKAIGYANNQLLGEADASANSMEETHRKVFQEFKNNTWLNKPNKSVFDVLNTIKQKAQIRAKKKLVRNILALSGKIGQDPELIDNPAANKQKVFSVYTMLYKYHLAASPPAPIKKKNKNGTWKMYSDKEKQQLRKEWCRVNILQPYLLANGIPTNGWGIKDVEALKEAIPSLEAPKAIGGEE